MFEPGCLLPTHGKTITSPADRAIVGQETGSLKAVFSQNGKDLGRVPYSGYTESVSHPIITLTHSHVDGFPVSTFVAGAGKSVIWCVII